MTAIKHWLQIFADGVEGASAMTAEAPAESVSETTAEPTTGETSSVAGSFADRLSALGVPQSKIRQRYRQMQAPSAAVPTEAPAQDPQPIPAEEPAQQAQETAKRLTWDEIMADPEYNRKMQETVQGRLKASKGAEERLKSLTPTLAALAAKYGLEFDPDAPDLDAINRAVDGDTSYYAKKAIEDDAPEDVTARLEKARLQLSQLERAEKQKAEQQKLADHFGRLQQQGEELKKTFPKFDLRAELQNPTFLRLTSPGVGLSVQDAYYAVHRQEIQQASMQVAAQRTAEQMSANIQSRQSRPQEVAMKATTAPVSQKAPQNMTRQEREEYKSRIRAAIARGEHPKPGDVI